MPSFPRHTASRQLTTQQPSFLATQDRSAQDTEMMGKIGGQVTEIAGQAIQHQDNIQKVTSLSNFKTGMLDIQQRAANDPDSNNSHKYKNEIEKLRVSSLEGFSSNQAKAEMALELGYQSEVGQIEVNNTYRKKGIKIGQASTLNLMELAATDTKQTPEQRVASIAAIADGAVNSQLYDPVSAMALQDKYTKMAKDTAFYDDMAANMDIAKENLDKNVYGYNSEELRSKKAEYNTEKTRVDKEILEQHNIAESSLTSSIVSDDPDAYKNVDSLVNDPENPITQNFANIVKDSHNYKFKTHGASDDKKLITLMSQYSKIKDTDGLMKFRDQVFINKGFLDEEKFKTFLSWTTPENEEIAFDQRNQWQKGLDWLGGKYKSGAKHAERAFEYMTSFMGKTGSQPVKVGDKKMHKGFEVTAFKDTDGIIKWRKS